MLITITTFSMLTTLPDIEINDPRNVYVSLEDTSLERMALRFRKGQ